MKRLLKLKQNVTSLSVSKPSKLRKLSKVKYLLGNIKRFNEIDKLLKKKIFDYVVNCGGYVEHTLKKKKFMKIITKEMLIYIIYLKVKKLNYLSK